MINIDEDTLSTKVLNNRSWLKSSRLRNLFQMYYGIILVAITFIFGGDYYVTILLKFNIERKYM